MGLYSTRDLKRKGGYSNFRKLDLQIGATRKIWIPENLFCYHRVHFSIKTLTTFKASKYNTLDCFNQNLEERGKGCPICAEVEQLWALWRAADKAKDANAKKEIMAKINRVSADYFVCNAIDLEDPDRKFTAVTFTRSKMVDIEKADENYGLQNLIWTYKKTEKGEGKTKKIDYVLLEDQNEGVTSELIASLEELKARSYEDGGLVDLEKATLRTYTMSQYMEILNGGESDDNRDDDEETPKTKAREAAATVEASETTSLDELGLDDDTPAKKDPPKKDPPKKDPPVKKEPPKKETPKEETIDSDLSLDDISLDEDEPAKNVTITAATIKEKKNDRAYIEKIYAYLLKEKKVEKKAEYTEKLTSVFNKAKEAALEIPESALK